MSTRTTRRLAAAAMAAAAVQVIGLSRWVLLVPGISRDRPGQDRRRPSRLRAGPHLARHRLGLHAASLTNFAGYVA